MFDLKLDYSELIDSLVAHFIENKNANVLLVPHVFGDHGESDTVAAQLIYDRLKNRHGSHLFCVQGSYDQNEIKHIIGLCEFFVGSRMHACIAALSQGIPAVGVAYSDKFAGVFDSVGAGSMVADPRRLTLDETVVAIERAFEEREASRLHLRHIMPGIKARVLALLDEVE
jgi:polysaccharide pyruvyl transferase WcaK-like protein